MDEVQASRAQIGFWVSIAKKVGYLAILASIVAVLLGAIFGFNAALGWVMAVGLGVATVLLPPAIILGYGIKKAIREDG